MMSARVTTTTNRCRAGFTLIELLAVLVIVAMVVGIVMISMRGSLKKAQRQLVRQKLESVDQRLRLAAVRSGRPRTMIIDLDSKCLWETRPSAREQSAVLLEVELPIRRIVIDGQVADYGQVPIVYRVDGSSSTYAVQFNDTSQRRQWILTAGRTGYCYAAQDAQEIAQLFQLQSTARFDAH